MLQLTYIFHSCFALETDNCILIFDYWLDPCNVMNLLRNVSMCLQAISMKTISREIYSSGEKMG